MDAANEATHIISTLALGGSEYMCDNLLDQVGPQVEVMCTGQACKCLVLCSVDCQIPVSSFTGHGAERVCVCVCESV